MYSTLNDFCPNTVYTIMTMAISTRNIKDILEDLSSRLACGAGGEAGRYWNASGAPPADSTGVKVDGDKGIVKVGDAGGDTVDKEELSVEKRSLQGDRMGADGQTAPSSTLFVLVVSAFSGSLTAGKSSTCGLATEPAGPVTKCTASA